MTWNICYRCGYDLTGLDLPRRCPECGQLCDPQAESEEAIRWYRKWWAPAALFYPEPIPGGLWFVTDDDGSLRRLARRRLLVWVWLPVVLDILLVGAGHFIEVNYNGDVDRLYAFELDIFPIRQSAWESPWRVSTPTELDTFTLGLALTPLVLMGFAWILPSRLLSLAIRRHSPRPNVGRFQLSLASPLLGIICWSWFLLMLVAGVTDAFN